jgi:hypothetical protein
MTLRRIDEGTRNRATGLMALFSIYRTTDALLSQFNSTIAGDPSNSYAAFNVLLGNRPP